MKAKEIERTRCPLNTQSLENGECQLEIGQGVGNPPLQTLMVRSRSVSAGETLVHLLLNCGGMYKLGQMKRQKLTLPRQQG